MKILLLTQVLPYPPDSGPKVKTWNLIKFLSRQHEVTLLSFVRGDQTRDVDQLKQYCVDVLTTPMERNWLRDGVALIESIFTGQPWLIVRDRRDGFSNLVREVTSRRKFDVVHADQLNMAQYAEHAHGSMKVVDTHNALWLLYQRMAETMDFGLKKLLFERDWRLLRRYEAKVCRSFDQVLAVSDEDRFALHEVCGEDVDIQVMPIAVDTDEFKVIHRDHIARRIVHVGTMFWQPNIDGILWFARNVLPLVREEMPDVGFDVIGARPPAEVTALSTQDHGIHVTGYVDDPTPYLEQAGVVVVPLRAGGGMRVKILNSLSQGLPIVTTSIGCEGIAVKSGVHLWVADNPQDFAQAVLTLLSDRSLADRLGINGRKLIESTYDYRSAYSPLDRIYQKNGRLNTRPKMILWDSP